MKFNKMYALIVEAFQRKDIPEAIRLIQAYIEKHTGEKLYQMGGQAGVDEFINAGGKGEGVRFFVGNTTDAIRFNFNTTGQIVSIDVWGGDNNVHPTINIDTSNVMSITKALPTLVGIIKNPVPGEYDVIITDAVPHNTNIFDTEKFKKESVQVTEAEVTIGKQVYKNKGAAVLALINQGMVDANEIARIIGNSPASVYSLARAAGKTVTIKAKKGSPETSADSDIPPAQEALAQQKFADPKVVFKDLEDLVKMVGTGVSNALFVCGGAGTGKTTTVTDTLDGMGKKEDEDYVKFTGASSARGLYEVLFLNHDKIVVCDDMDSVFKDPQAVNILKGSLDTKKVRRISWISANQFSPADPNDIDSIMSQAKEYEKLPNTFPFSGSVIFISNLPKSKIDDAIISRTYTIDVTLKASDMLARIESIKYKLVPDIDKKIVDMVIKYLKEIDITSKTDTFNLRSFIKAAKLAASGSPDWKGLIDRYALA